jgi:hypothetical protein
MTRDRLAIGFAILLSIGFHCFLAGQAHLNSKHPAADYWFAAGGILVVVSALGLTVLVRRALKGQPGHSE